MLIDDEEGNVMDIADDADRLQTLLYSAYDSDTVREMERPLLDDGVPLMRMAASAAAHVTMTLLDDEDLAVEDARVALLVGEIMAATVYTPARNWRTKARMSPRSPWDVPCTRRRSARSCMPEAVFSYLIPPPKSQDAPRVFPRERPENDCRPPLNTFRAPM